MEFTKEEKEEAEAIVSRLSLNQKVHLMSGKVSIAQLVYHSIFRHYNYVPYPTGDIKLPWVYVPPVMFVDGPRGCVASNSATCFPVSSARGATFDVDLERRVGEAIAKEIKANKGNFFGGVCINLIRHPSMGRAQESYGEDPFHVGQMGRALTEGIQSHNVMACVKHFALNNQENERFNINCVGDERALREVYLAHFYEVVKHAKVAAVMVSVVRKLKDQRDSPSF